MRVRYNPTTRVISYLCQVPLRISRTMNLFGDLLHHTVHEHVLLVISCRKNGRARSEGDSSVDQVWHKIISFQFQCIL